jgi:uncharacterized membrane protein
MFAVFRLAKLQKMCYNFIKVKRACAKKQGAVMKQTIKTLGKRYFIDAMGSMALGLFASLLISTILGTLAKYTGFDFLNVIAKYAKDATGMAIGVAIAYKLGAKPLVVFSCAAVGAMSNALGAVINEGAITEWAVAAKAGEGVFYSAGPAGAFFAVIIAAEIAGLVAGKTRVDILVTPVVTLLVGFGASWLLCPLVSYVMYYLGVFVATATTFQPLLMGIAVSVVVGMILTLPISSAAICALTVPIIELKLFAKSANSSLPLSSARIERLPASMHSVVFCKSSSGRESFRKTK